MAKIGKEYFTCKTAERGGIELDVFCSSKGVFSIKLPTYLIPHNDGQKEANANTRDAVVNLVRGLCKMADQDVAKRDVIAYKYEKASFDDIPIVGLHIAFYEEIEYTTPDGPAWVYERRWGRADDMPRILTEVERSNSCVNVLGHSGVRKTKRPDNIIPDTPVNREFIRRAGVFLEKTRELCDSIFDNGGIGLIEAILRNQPLALTHDTHQPDSTAAEPASHS